MISEILNSSQMNIKYNFFSLSQIPSFSEKALLNLSKVNSLYILILTKKQILLMITSTSLGDR